MEWVMQAGVGYSLIHRTHGRFLNHNLAPALHDSWRYMTVDRPVYWILVINNVITAIRRSYTDAGRTVSQLLPFSRSQTSPLFRNEKTQNDSSVMADLK